MKKHLPGFGINVEILSTHKNTVDQYIGVLKDLRVEWVRLIIDYYHPTDLLLLTTFAQACRANGIRILGQFVNNIPGTLLNLFIPYRWYRSIYQDQDLFNAFVKRYSKALSGYISHWEILNEMDTLRFSVERPNPLLYTKLLAHIGKTIRSIDKNSKIVFSATLGDGSQKIIPFHWPNFLAASLQLGAARHFDILSFHPYTRHNSFSRRDIRGYLDDFKKSIDAIKQAVRQTKKPAWITEYGISSRWVKLTGSEIAQVYTKAYSMCRAYHIPFILWHLADIRKQIYEPGSPEKHYGLLHEDLTPKPIFHALREKLQNI
ncbi:cellulase family glycosylhydrolase [Candidatus Gottesmanbacteria bacterium]|nr:cellulase family glycosylhydrolase [Candidatus Gottesmanbacteria bacterium]